MKIPAYNDPRPETVRPAAAQRLAAGLLTLIGWFWGLLADVPHVPVIVMIICLAALLCRRTFVLNRRAAFYVVIAALALALVGERLFPFATGRFGTFVMIFGGEWTMAAILYAAAMLLFFWYPMAWGSLIPAAVLLLLCGAGDLVFFGFGRDDPQRLLNDEAVRLLETHFRPLFLLVSLAAALAVIGLAAGSETSARFGRARSRRRPLKVAVLLLIALAWGGLWELYQAYSREIGDWENRFILRLEKWSRPNRRRSRSVQFAQNVNLRQPFPDNREAEALILLRVDGEVPPGYLRSRSFQDYHNGTWMADDDSAELRTALTASEVPGLSAMRFQRGGAEGTIGREWRVFWSSHFRSTFLPVSGNYVRLELIGEEVFYYPGGQTVAPDWLRSGGYRVGVPEFEPMAAWPEPEEPAPGHLRLPPELPAALDRVLAGIEGMEPKLSAADRVGVLLEFFERDFQYSLGTEFVAEEPVIHFLEQSRAGHCELFASAMTLLLRRLGIPARYVTGFIGREPHPDGGYYVVRVGHAHAWLEWYDAVSRRWRAADPTPAGELPDYSDEWNFFNRANDRAAHFFSGLFSSLRRGEVAEALKSLLVNVYALTLIGLLLSFYLYRKVIRPRLGRKRERRYRLDTAAEFWRRRYENWLAGLIRRRKLKLTAGMTAAEILELVRNSENFSEAEKSEAAAFVAEYRRERFRVK